MGPVKVDRKPRFNEGVEDVMKRLAKYQEEAAKISCFTCECGAVLTKHHRARHLRRQIHMDLMKEKAKQ